MGQKADYKTEDLAIQETLSMTAPERLQLLAALIVDKIDQVKETQKPFTQTVEEQNV